MPADQSGFREVKIAKGQTESQEIPIAQDQLIAPAGQITGAQGNKLKGAKPDFDVQESGAGSKIVLSQAASEDLVFKVKEKAGSSAGDDDDDDGDDQTEPPAPSQQPA
jgi:hypothetical protein